MSAGEAATARGRWSPDCYARHAGFVPELGDEILSWLAPRPAERILDLGCGDGKLTLRLVDAGAEVVGVDSSPEMVAAARAAGIDARRMSGEALEFDSEFDAVFSSAALHWMRRASDVAAGVARALRPGGRFVAELGGHGNVAAVITALQAARHVFGGAAGPADPCYFPTAEAYAKILEGAGLTVIRTALVPRPTPLPTAMDGWLETFFAAFFDQFEGARRGEVLGFVVGLLRPALCDDQGRWSADYVRLRVEARRPG